MWFSILFRYLGVLTCLMGFVSTHVGATTENDPVFDVPRLDAITIDGKGDDWGDRGFRVEALASSTHPIPSPHDFDAGFRLGWEKRGLLLLAMVSDDTYLESKNESSLWSRDSVELFMAPALGGADLYQIVIGPGLDTETPVLRYHIHDYRKNAPLLKVNVEITAARTKTATGYVLEVLLPWENLGIKPALGRELAFQITINDSDSPQDRIQWLWYPVPETYADSNKMYRLRLSASSSPAVPVAVVGEYERFRRTRVRVTGTAGLVGKTVEIREGGRVLGTGRLAGEGGRAFATLLLPMPSLGQSYGPLTVWVDGQHSTTTVVPDVEEQRRRAFRSARMKFTPFVFSGNAFPPVEFEQPSLAEDLIGRYTLKTTFYDADYSAVNFAERPGRYGAIVEIEAEGQVLKRFLTLFRQPEPIDWDEQNLQVALQLPKGLGIDATVVKEQAATVSEALKQQLVGSFEHDGDTAVLFAGLYETEAGSGPAKWRNDVWEKDRKWWYGLKRKTGDITMLKYLLYVPPKYSEDDTTRWPLMLFLHGAGERGDDLEKVQVHGPPKLVAQGKHFPFILVSPQCPSDEWWLPAQLSDLLDEIRATYRVDQDRIYVTGLSMGGYGTWSMAMEYPSRFAAIAPICGGGDSSDVARIAHLPTWVFHGAKDSVVPLKRSEDMVEALKKVSGPVRFTVYPEAGHDSWTETYNNPDLYEWFLQHRRGKTR